MPSKSAKQRRFMAAAAHNPDFAKKAGIPQSVAKEFNRADTHEKGMHWKDHHFSGKPHILGERCSTQSGVYRVSKKS